MIRSVLRAALPLTALGAWMSATSAAPVIDAAALARAAPALTETVQWQGNWGWWGGWGGAWGWRPTPRYYSWALDPWSDVAYFNAPVYESVTVYPSAPSYSYPTYSSAPRAYYGTGAYYGAGYGARAYDGAGYGGRAYDSYRNGYGIGGYPSAGYSGRAYDGAGYREGGYYAAADDVDAVNYCRQRYRTYNRRTGTYMGNDGYRHPCP